MINLDYTTHHVQEVRTVNEDLFELVLDRNDCTFDPGDCTAIYTDTDKSRPYSIASGAGEDELRFVIRRMDGGEVSPWLMSRRPGDTVRITPPFGWFRPGQDIGDAPFAFIATGTGIAPFLSYLNTFSRPPIHCLYGVRRFGDAIGYERLFHFCPTRLAVSRETAQGHHHGHVTDLLDNLPEDPRMHYYICGLESMVKDVSHWLLSRETPSKHIHREVFFHG